MGAHAPLGGPREIALACLLVVRVAVDAGRDGVVLTPEQRRTRAAHIRHWLGAATLPGPVRAALVRLADATVPDQPALASALDAVMTVTANNLEPAARLELGKLAQALAE